MANSSAKRLRIGDAERQRVTTEWARHVRADHGEMLSAWIVRTQAGAGVGDDALPFTGCLACCHYSGRFEAAP